MGIKAQLEFNTIMKLILAIVVLVSVITLFAGAISVLSQPLNEAAERNSETSSLATAKATCTTLCTSLRSDRLLAPTDVANKQYCTTNFILSGKTEKSYCYSDEILGDFHCKIRVNSQDSFVNRELCEGNSLQ